MILENEQTLKSSKNTKNNEWSFQDHKYIYKPFSIINRLDPTNFEGLDLKNYEI